MSNLGSFELLRELHRSPHAQVFAARRVGDVADVSGRLAVKAFDAESVGLLESVAAGATFIECAKVQKKLSASAARHWAPVLEIGTIDDPYYATELFPLTAQRVVNRQAFVGEHGLYTVVWSVVRGLTELRETFRRAHGNLKLSNVLISGDESLASPKTTRVVLCDPSAEGATARDRAADLLAIGELIHRLVLRRPFKPSPADETPFEPAEYPVPMTAAWEKLGPNGREWLDLCNWLLSPSPADRPADLVELAVALHRLTPRVSRFPTKKLALAVVPIVLAGAGVGVFHHVHTGVRNELQAANQQWFSQLDQGLRDTTRTQRWSSSDESLREVATTVNQARAQGVRFDISGDSTLSWGNYENAKSALATVRRVEQALSAEKWAGLGTLADLRAKYASRGWAQPAAYLGELTTAVHPTAGSDVAAGVDRLLNAAEQLRAEAGALEDSWTQYDADLKTVEKADDRALSAFARRLRESVASSIRLTDDGFEGIDALKLRVPIAAALAKTATDNWPARVDRARMADEVDARLNLADPGEQEISSWLSAVPEYELIALDKTAEPFATLTATFRKLTDDVSKQTFTEADQAGYQADRDKVQAKLNTLADAKFVRKDVARGQGELTFKAGEIQRDLDALRKSWVRLDDPKLWADFIDTPLAVASDVLKSRWKGYVAHQRKQVDALAKNPEAFKTVKARAGAIRDILAELDKQFPLGVAGLQEPYITAALEKREQELRGLTAWADAAGGEPEPPDLDPWGKQAEARIATFKGWVSNLHDLGKDFPIQKELLTVDDRPDLSWIQKDQVFWQDPIVQRLVKEDVDRIAELGGVAKMSRAELISAAKQSEATEVVVAAYRRLGEPPASGTAWPATPEDLDTDFNLRTRLDQKLRQVRSDAERKAPYDEWRQQGPARWKRFADRLVLTNADDPAEPLERKLLTAIRYQSVMLAGAAQVEQLDPVARFNYALYLARVAVTDPSVTGGVDPVARAAAELGKAAGQLKDRPEIAELGRRMGRLSDREPMSDDARLLSPQPPKSVDVALRQGAAITFVRVEAQGQRPFYLASTELSLGQFIDLVNARGNWPAANALLGNVSTPGGAGPTPLRGPRLWDRPSAADVAIDRFPETWRFDTPERVSQEFVFAEPLRRTRFNRRALKPEFGDNPRYDHPMQHLPAGAALYAAALANCRLPTTREWLAGYEIDRKQIAAGSPTMLDANLRDKTWQTQREFATPENAPGQWPDAAVSGVYWPKAAKVPAVSVRKSDDQTLFFRSVTGGGGTFPNIIGNVAELVCDHADAFDATPDRKSVPGITKFSQSYGGQVMVMGGSAFSAPELELLTPAPVNAVTDPYTDVGVRLAFTAPARSVAERLGWYLAEQRYLAAASVAAK